MRPHSGYHQCSACKTYAKDLHDGLCFRCRGEDPHVWTRQEEIYPLIDKSQFSLDKLIEILINTKEWKSQCCIIKASPPQGEETFFIRFEHDRYGNLYLNFSNDQSPSRFFWNVSPHDFRSLETALLAIAYSPDPQLFSLA